MATLIITVLIVLGGLALLRAELRYQSTHRNLGGHRRAIRDESAWDAYQGDLNPHDILDELDNSELWINRHDRS